MGRTAKPWCYRQTGWWMVWFNGRKVKLAEGRKNKKEAQDRFDELRYEASKNPPPETDVQLAVDLRLFEQMPALLAQEGAEDDRAGIVTWFRRLGYISVNPQLPGIDQRRQPGNQSAREMSDGLETPVLDANRVLVVGIVRFPLQVDLLAGGHVGIIILHSDDSGLDLAQKLLSWGCWGLAGCHGILLGW